MDQAREMELQLKIDRLLKEKRATQFVLEWHFGSRPKFGCRQRGDRPPSDWQEAPEYLQKMLGLQRGSP